MAGGIFKVSCPFCVTNTVMSNSTCPRCGNGPGERQAAAKKAKETANKKVVAGTRKAAKKK